MSKGLWDSYKTLIDIRKRMNDLVQQSLHQFDLNHQNQSGTPVWTPPFDLVESESDFILYGELPGVKKDDLQVLLKGTELIIRGERKAEPMQSSATYHLAERFYGSFQRTFKLPDYIADPTHITTTLKEGLMEIRLPKRKVRTIPIQ